MLCEENCAPSLEEFLKKNVTALAGSQDPCTSARSLSLQLYVLSDEYEYELPKLDFGESFTFMHFTPRRFRNEYLARKHLMLVYQNGRIVLGMTSFEYAFDPIVAGQKVIRWSRSYIQYIDSTGLYEPRANQSYFTKSLVKNYLKYCGEVLNMQSVHLLATAKPAFLFAGSEYVDGKRPLPSVKLINWWIGVLRDFTRFEGAGSKVYVFSPFEEAERSQRLRKKINSIENWCYGLPYNLKAPCIDQIPLFEDDPKWRHFVATVLDDDEILEASERSLAKKPRIIDSEDEADEVRNQEVQCKMSLREFFESIQLRPEFRCDPSSFFVLRFPDRLVDLPLTPTQGNKSDLATFGMKMLSNLTFESESEARKSSQKIFSWLKLMGRLGVRVSEIGFDEIDNSDLEATKENQPAVINSLQSLIKKKPNEIGMK